MAVYLQAALVCERILVEADGVLSAIRIIDSLTAGAEPTAQAPVLAALSVLVALKFDEGPRPSRIVIDLVTPAGGRARLVESPAGRPGENGANIFGQIQLVFVERGAHWFHVLADDAEITRIPLTILVAQPTIAGGAR